MSRWMEAVVVMAVAMTRRAVQQGCLACSHSTRATKLRSTSGVLVRMVSDPRAEVVVVPVLCLSMASLLSWPAPERGPVGPSMVVPVASVAKRPLAEEGMPPWAQAPRAETEEPWPRPGVEAVAQRAAAWPAVATGLEVMPMRWAVLPAERAGSKADLVQTVPMPLEVVAVALGTREAVQVALARLAPVVEQAPRGLPRQCTMSTLQARHLLQAVERLTP
mmetsp:Transcript_2123/g.8276  ORF Transcript_2123/g.8276 Transcript_2123/m.8276 type:complete len:220 (+) Transcript_2123:348-1007(+)